MTPGEKKTYKVEFCERFLNEGSRYHGIHISQDIGRKSSDGYNILRRYLCVHEIMALYPQHWDLKLFGNCPNKMTNAAKVVLRDLCKEFRTKLIRQLKDAIIMEQKKLFATDISNREASTDSSESNSIPIANKRKTPCDAEEPEARK